MLTEQKQRIRGGPPDGFDPSQDMRATAFNGDRRRNDCSRYRTPQDPAAMFARTILAGLSTATDPLALHRGAI